LGHVLVTLEGRAPLASIPRRAAQPTAEPERARSVEGARVQFPALLLPGYRPLRDGRGVRAWACRPAGAGQSHSSGGTPASMALSPIYISTILIRLSSDSSRRNKTLCIIARRFTLRSCPRRLSPLVTEGCYEDGTGVEPSAEVTWRWSAKTGRPSKTGDNHVSLLCRYSRSRDFVPKT
jgi:hypothetical protein